MTDKEWAGVVAVITADWPHHLPPQSALAKWRRDVDHLPGEQVLTAVEALYRDGERFPPNGAQILAKVSELGRDDPDHGEAWALAKRANLKADAGEGMRWLRERSPVAAEAVRRLASGGRHALMDYGLDEEQTIRAQFRDVFRAVVEERRRDDAYQGLPHANLRGVQRGPRRLGEALRHALPQQEGS